MNISMSSYPPPSTKISNDIVNDSKVLVYLVISSLVLSLCKMLLHQLFSMRHGKELNRSFQALHNRFGSEIPLNGRT